MIFLLHNLLAKIVCTLCLFAVGIFAQFLIGLQSLLNITGLGRVILKIWLVIVAIMVAVWYLL